MTIDDVIVIVFLLSDYCVVCAIIERGVGFVLRQFLGRLCFLTFWITSYS